MLTLAQKKMQIVLVEPFFAGSHQSWAEEFQANSQHDIELLTLPGRHWKWRMHGGAISLAKKFNQFNYRPDLILVSDMLDLALFSSLLKKDFQSIPKAVYFHENQLTYPWSPTDPDPSLARDNHYAFINYTTALVADQVFFNSLYHKDSFINSLDGFLKRFPDHKELDQIELIREKSKVLSLGLDLGKFDDYSISNTENDIPIILWNHRWEYDKNPESFFNLLYQLDQEGVDFQLVVLGESFGKKPAIFKEAQSKLKEKIIHWGFAKSFGEYAQWIWKADILPITTVQDFFGISVIQAIYCECTPLLPFRLAYPNHFPKEIHDEIFYQNEEELLEKMKELVNNFTPRTYQDQISKYDWKMMIGTYDNELSSLVV